MSSDLSVTTQKRLDNIREARILQEYYDEQQRIYERNKLKRDLEHERDKENIKRAHKSEVARQALDEIHMLSDRIKELEEVIRKNSG